MTKKKLSLIPLSENPYNAETPLSALRYDLTPINLAYVRNHFDVPTIDKSEWSLEVAAGTNSFSISLTELQMLPTQTLTIVLECAGNGRKSMNPVPEGTAWEYGAISIVEFTGTALRNIFSDLEISKFIVEVGFHGADRGKVNGKGNESFIRSLPIDVALDSNTILAWEMNGQALTPDHGFPLRLVVPNWYAMASIKWLEKVELLTEPYKGYFQYDDYVYVDEQGPNQSDPVRHIRTRSLIISPSEGQALNKGEIKMAGIAWSGEGPLTQVEVSVDGGRIWSEADLEPKKSQYGVYHWSYTWQADEQGEYTLATRAKGSAGNSQPSIQIWNRKGYGNNGPHEVVVTVT